MFKHMKIWINLSRRNGLDAFWLLKVVKLYICLKLYMYKYIQKWMFVAIRVYLIAMKTHSFQLRITKICVVLDGTLNVRLQVGFRRVWSRQSKFSQCILFTTQFRKFQYVNDKFRLKFFIYKFIIERIFLILNLIFIEGDEI